MIVQPASGYHRSGSDAVFLAATLENITGRVLDMGSGAGVVGLVVAHRNPLARVTLAENDPVMLAASARSLAANPHLLAHVETLPVDLLAPEPVRLSAGLGRAAFDHVITNPPYRRAGHVRTAPAKQAAHVVSLQALDGWMRTAASALKPGGTLTLIFAADGLLDLMEAFKGRFGAVSILGLHPREGAPAERLLIRAIKGRRTPPVILPGLVLHGEQGLYTTQASAILDGQSGISLG